MTANDKKVIYLDLDGTLLNDKREITDGNRKAIYEALDAGHKVVIATGRPLISGVEQAEKLGLTYPGCYCIAYNGSTLYDLSEKKKIFEKTMPLDTVYRIFDEANRRGLHIQTYSDTRVLVEPRCEGLNVQRYCSKINMQYEVIGNIRELKTEPVKVLMIDYDDQTEIARMRDWLINDSGFGLDSFFSCKEYVEVVCNGIDKGNAILQMADILGIPRSNTIAVGDEANDLGMIRSAAVGVCMANGIAACKEAADYVTAGDNNHDGVAEVIYRFMLNKD